MNLLLLRGGFRHLAQNNNVIRGEADIRSPRLEKAARRAEDFQGLAAVVDGETKVVAVVSTDTRKERWCTVVTEDFSDDGVILLVGRFAECTGAFLVGGHAGTCYVGRLPFSIFSWDDWAEVELFRTGTDEADA